MKKLHTILSIFTLIVIFAFAAPEVDESIYASKYIKYSVERDGSAAVVNLDIVNLEQYDAIYLKRSDNPTDDFRQVKYLNQSQIKSLAKNASIIDKYPLPGNKDAYYKLTAISNKGIYKLFPCVKLSKY